MVSCIPSAPRLSAWRSGWGCGPTTPGSGSSPGAWGSCWGWGCSFAGAEPVRVNFSATRRGAHSTTTW
jgi:hypothetical protein